MNEKTPETYDPSETIRLRIFKPEIGYDKYVDIMPSQMDNVKLLERQGFQVSRVASPKTSGTGAFLGGLLRGATFELEEEGYGLLGGDEVQLEAQKQRQREDIERPGAVLAGQVVGSLIGAPAKLAGAGTKAASKLGPMGARAIKSLLGAGEAAATGIAAKPMGEKDDISLSDAASIALGGVLGGVAGKGKKAAQTEEIPPSTTSQTLAAPEAKPSRTVLASKEGQVEEARRLIEKAKKEGSYTDINVVNNQVVDQTGTPVTLYRGSRRKNPFGIKEIRNFLSFSTNPNVAKTYSGNKGFITEAKITINNPLIVDANGNTVNDIPVQTSKGLRIVDTDKLVKRAKELGYDGVIIKNVQTQGPKAKTFLPPGEKLGTNVFVFDKKQVIEPKVFDVQTNELIKIEE